MMMTTLMAMKMGMRLAMMVNGGNNADGTGCHSYLSQSLGAGSH